MIFCRRVFLLATLYGVLVVPPAYFLEPLVARLDPPAISHPEYYYGFVGGALAWQVVYFIVVLDPLRFRPMILLSALAKLGLVATVAMLLATERGGLLLAAPVLGDFVFGLLFIYADRLVAREIRA
ncbi:MAG: hypothetical protein AB7O59_17280 [Pirellulales bacterium]